MKRIFLFIAVNLLVILTLSLVIHLLGLRPYITARGIDYGALLAFCAVFGFGGAIISLQLSRWTAKRMMGVQLIDPQRPDGAEEEFIAATVSDLCRRAGLSTLPEIGIYPSPEVNAFATGPSRNRALLAISEGLLRSMDRKAAEAVIGHEISHIANGDMVTMTLVQGLVNTFVIFAARVAAFAIDNAMRSRDDRRGGGLGFFAQYMLISLFETVFMLLASPLIYSFSRMREYRADRGSAGMLGAAAMIHALEALKAREDRVDNSQAALAAFKINGRAPGLMAALFSSHPPLDKRIEALKRLT